MAIKWLVRRDGTLCVDKQAGSFRDSDCYTLSIHGEVMTLSTSGRPPISGRIVKGDALKR